MLVAVTGGTGLIGKKLIERLVKRGDTIRLLSRSAKSVGASTLVQPCECDLLNVGINELSSMLEGVDVLYHCAGQLTDVKAMRSLHVDATRKLTMAATRRVSHWVQLSSVGVYGLVSHGEITERTAPNPVGPYETTKLESDKIVINAASQNLFTCSILRPSNVFGADMSNQSLFRMINMIDRGLFFYIGRPGPAANYVHVDNVAEGLILCGTMPQAVNEIYNISDHCSLECFVETISVQLGRVAPRLIVPEAIVRLAVMALGRLPGFPLTKTRVDALVNFSSYPVLKIKQELGYQPVVAMEDGLRELVEAYRRQIKHARTA